MNTVFENLDLKDGMDAAVYFIGKNSDFCFYWKTGMSQVLLRTRIAPTPSGFLHVGNVYSFALTAAIAKRTKASILLRIDDMDRDRFQPDYLNDIFETLNFLGIPWQQGPFSIEEFERKFSQRLRLPLYHQTLHRLQKKGLLYACGCSRAELLRQDADGKYTGVCRNKNLPLDAPDTCWRVKTDHLRELVVNTLGGNKIYVTLPEIMSDFIVRKKDGFPAYQLCSLVDDLHFDINLVVRGDDLWPSTLAQLYLADLLGEEDFSKTVFLHHPLLTGDGGRKLSKSAGDTSVQYLRKQGATAADVYKKLGEMLDWGTTPRNYEEVELPFG